MSFKVGRQFLEDYSRTRADELSKGARLSWSTTGGTTLEKQLDVFDREEDRAAWEKLHKSQPDISKVMGVNNRIAWLCGCARDFRLQFAVRKDNVPRTSVDHSRLALAMYKWVEKGLITLKALNAERDKGLSNEPASGNDTGGGGGF